MSNINIRRPKDPKFKLDAPVTASWTKKQGKYTVKIVAESDEGGTSYGFEVYATRKGKGKSTTVRIGVGEGFDLSVAQAEAQLAIERMSL